MNKLARKVLEQTTNHPKPRTNCQRILNDTCTNYHWMMNTICANHEWMTIYWLNNYNATECLMPTTSSKKLLDTRANVVGMGPSKAVIWHAVRNRPRKMLPERSCYNQAPYMNVVTFCVAHSTRIITASSLSTDSKLVERSKHDWRWLRKTYVTCSQQCTCRNWRCWFWPKCLHCEEC